MEKTIHIILDWAIGLMYINVNCLIGYLKLYTCIIYIANKTYTIRIPRF